MNRRVSLVLGRNAPGFPCLSPNPVENSVESVENLTPGIIFPCRVWQKSPLFRDIPEQRAFFNASEILFHEDMFHRGIAQQEDFPHSMVPGPLIEVLGCDPGIQTDMGGTLFPGSASRASSS